MGNFNDPRRALLHQIAEALGVPVERFFTGSMCTDANECLRLWSRIRTEAGRRQALEALRAIIEREGT